MQTTNDTNTYTIVMPIALPPSTFRTFKKSRAAVPLRLAGALNSSEPIKKPQTHCTCDIENHLADSDLYIAIRCCRGHRISFSLGTNNMSRLNSAPFLTHRYSYVI